MLSRLAEDDKLQAYDCVDLTFGNYCYRYGKTPTIRNNIAATVTTKAFTDIAVVIGDLKK